MDDRDNKRSLLLLAGCRRKCWSWIYFP